MLQKKKLEEEVQKVKKRSATHRIKACSKNTCLFQLKGHLGQFQP